MLPLGVQKIISEYTEYIQPFIDELTRETIHINLDLLNDNNKNGYRIVCYRGERQWGIATLYLSRIYSKTLRKEVSSTRPNR